MSKVRAISEKIRRIYAYAENPENLPALLETLEDPDELDVSKSSVFELLEPHFESALNVARIRETAEPFAEFASIKIDDEFRLVGVNSAGLDLLDKFTSNNQVGHPICQPHDELYETLAAARAEFRVQGAASFVCKRNAGSGFVGRILPVSGDVPQNILHLACLRWGPDLPVNLSGLSSFGLTKAETRLVSYLARGESLNQAAKDIGVSENTVRSQIKSVFEKTGANSQPSLVALIHMTSTLATVSAPFDHGIHVDGIPARRTTILEDGRRLAFRGYGDSAGTPVLVLTGFFAASFLSPGKASAAYNSGCRAIVPDRPGTGESERHPGRSVRSLAKDLIDLVGSEFEAQTAILANAHMATVACEMASLSPDLVSQVLLINPQFEFARSPDDSKAQIGVYGRRLMSMALKQPRLVAPVSRLLLKQTPKSLRARLLKTIMALTPSDRIYLDLPQNIGELIQSIEDSQIESSMGFADDIAMLAEHGKINIPDRVPIHAWLGSELYDSGQVQEFEARFPSISKTLVPDQGAMLFHAEFESALKSLI